jgi:transcriptional antiterminator RfaH
MPQQWLLVQVKPREELRAMEHLQNQGCTAYCPQINLEKITRGKRTTKLEPLFPGYLFVQNPNNQDSETNETSETNTATYTSIRSTRGVAKIVRFGTDYTLLSDQLIQSIINREKSLTQAGSDSYTTTPKQGDTVTITQGPFQGLEAIYQQSDGQMRSMVLINLLHQQTSIRIDNTAIAI